MKNLFYLFFAMPLFFSCGDGGDGSDDVEKKPEKAQVKKEESPVKLNEEYSFYDVNSELSCNECDGCWRIKFTSETNGQLWSKPCKKTSLKSCVSDFTYKYDKASQTVTIQSVNNYNVSSQCLNNFVGEWVWKKNDRVKWEKRFYSKKHSENADFS